MLEIESYNLVQADHLNNVKRGGGCIYHKESLPVYAINLPYFKETLLLKMSHNNRFYRLPSQNNDELDLTLSNFEKLITDIKNRKAYLSVITCDFNARSSSRWYNDINNNTEGA